MRRFKVNAFTLGILAGLLLVLGSGNAFFAHAVLSGQTSNPTFGPQDDDVKFGAKLDCKIIGSAIGAGDATCPAGYTLTGGGGACGADAEDNPRFVPSINPSTGVGSFHAECDGGGGEWSYAVCCK